MDDQQKQAARGSLNILKRALQNENYLKAVKKVIEAHKNAIKNGCY